MWADLLTKQFAVAYRRRAQCDVVGVQRERRYGTEFDTGLNFYRAELYAREILYMQSSVRPSLCYKFFQND